MTGLYTQSQWRGMYQGGVQHVQACIHSLSGEVCTREVYSMTGLYTQS